MGSPAETAYVPEPGASPTVCKAFLAVGVLAVVAYWLFPVRLGQNLVYIGIGLASAVAILVGVRLNRPNRTAPWILMALGQLVWTVGDALGVWDANILQIERFPAPADGAYLLAYPLLAASLVMLQIGRAHV